MSNPYYQYSAPVVAGTTIRADKYNSDQQSIETAFDTLDSELQRALFLPSTFTGNPVIPEQTVSNTFLFINGVGDLALYPIQTILDQFELATQQYTQIQAWSTQVESDRVSASSSEAIATAKAAESAASATSSANSSSTAGSHALTASRYATLAPNQLIPGTTDYSARHWAAEAESYAQQTLSAVNGDFVPQTRTINGYPLSSNVNLSIGDINGFGTAATRNVTTTATDTTANALLKVGDFGLGGVVGVLPPSNNLDSITASGFYITDGLTASQPVGASANSTVFANVANSNNQVQYYTRQNGNQVYFRNKVGGVWGAWQELWHTGKPNTFTDSILDATLTRQAPHAIYFVGTSSANRTINLSNTTFVDKDIVEIIKNIQANTLTVNTTGGEIFILPDGNTPNVVTLSAGVQASIVFSRFSGGWSVAVRG